MIQNNSKLIKDQTKYYLLSTGSSGCPSCNCFEKNIIPKLLKLLVSRPNIEYINYVTAELNTFTKDLNEKDKRITTAMKKNKISWVPNLSLVEKNKFDDQSKQEIDFLFFHGQLGVDKIIEWVDETTKSKINI